MYTIGGTYQFNLLSNNDTWEFFYQVIFNGNKPKSINHIADPEPVGSIIFCRIRVQIMDPDPHNKS